MSGLSARLLVRLVLLSHDESGGVRELRYFGSGRRGLFCAELIWYRLWGNRQTCQPTVTNLSPIRHGWLTDARQAHTMRIRL